MVNQETSQLFRKPLKDEVFDVLHEQIIAGRYAPGEWLRQEDISSQLGISMTPVREALELLVSAGLAERIPFRGVRVYQPTVQEIADSYAMRLLLESSAVYATAFDITSIQIQRLEEILDQSKSLLNLEDMSRKRVLSRELHVAFVFASGNALLQKMYLTVLNTFPDWLLYEYLSKHPENLNVSATVEDNEHRAIIDALAYHQPALALERTIDHIKNLGRELENYLGIPGELLRMREDRILPMLIQIRNK